MTARVTGWGLPACIAVGAPMLLGGCLGLAGDPVARTDTVALQAPAATAGPPIKVVRRDTASQVADADDGPADGNPLPTPRQIFDFHPPGSRPDTWRQPFIIDPNDGPLAGYVRRMDAELAQQTKEVGAADKPPARKKVCPSSGPVGTIAASCGENETAKAMAR